jgi:hypothetical protein
MFEKTLRSGKSPFPLARSARVRRPRRSATGLLIAFLAVALGVFGQAGTTAAVAAVPTNYVLQYQGHVQDQGWTSPASDGGQIGTTGLGKRLEAFWVRLNPSIAGGVCYDADVQGLGWQHNCNGGVVGTTGQSRALWHLKVSLTGVGNSHVNICYSVHVQDQGWKTAVCNGTTAGFGGTGLRIEAVKMWVDALGAGQSKTVYPTSYGTCIQNDTGATAYYHAVSGLRSVDDHVDAYGIHCGYFAGAITPVTVTNITAQGAGTLIKVFGQTGP